MPYRLEFLRSAQRELDHLPQDIQERISNRLAVLESEPRPSGVVALQGPERLLRLRVGDYRVIYRVEDDNQSVLIVRVAHRRDVYRR